MPNGKQGNTGKIKNSQKGNLSTVEIIELAMRKERNKGEKKVLVKIVLYF